MPELDAKREELEQLLRNDIPDLSGKDVWVWGAGNTASLYQQGFLRLKEEGFEVAGYVDSNLSKVGTFCGKPVVSPDEIFQKNGICVLICSIQPTVIAEIKESLKKYWSVEHHLIGEVILKIHSSKVMQVYDLLEDDTSKDLYVELVCCFLKGNAVDFYSIPLLVKEILPEYHLAIRHHTHKLADTILYAWV